MSTSYNKKHYFIFLIFQPFLKASLMASSASVATLTIFSYILHLKMLVGEHPQTLLLLRHFAYAQLLIYYEPLPIWLTPLEKFPWEDNAYLNGFTFLTE